MNASLFKWIRGRAHSVALALVAAFLLPMLLAVMPGPALSAEARLEQALAQSLCTPAGEPSMPLARHVHEDCCILCATGLPPVGEGNMGEGLRVVPPAPAATAVMQVADFALPARPLLFSSAITLRGPPAVL